MKLRSSRRGATLADVCIQKVGCGMALGVRKLIVVATLRVVLLLANVLVIANWLNYAGITGLAQ